MTFAHRMIEAGIRLGYIKPESEQQMLIPPNGLLAEKEAEIAQLCDTVEHYRADAAHDESVINELRAENEKLRAALQNCKLFFDVNNRPNHVAMIDAALGNERVSDD